MGTVHAFPPRELDDPNTVRPDAAVRPDSSMRSEGLAPEYETDRPVPASENLDAPAVHRGKRTLGFPVGVRRPRSGARASWPETLPTPRRRPLAESPMPPSMPRPRRNPLARHRRPRRWLALLRRSIFFTLVVGLPAALVIWVFTGQQFSLAEVEVQGTDRVSNSELLHTLAPYRGQNLPRLSLTEVRKKVLARHPWLSDVSLDKQLPDGLRVAGVARQPVALALDRLGYRYVDADGRPIARLQDDPVAQASADAQPELPILLGLRSEVDVQRGLDMLERWRQVEAPWRGEIQAIEILSDDDFLLRPHGLFPLLVRLGDLQRQATGLTRVLPELQSRYPEEGWQLDLRVPGRMIWTRQEAEMTSNPAQRGIIEKTGDGIAPPASTGSLDQG